MDDLRGYLMTQMGWDLKTVDHQDRTQLLDMLQRLSEKDGNHETKSDTKSVNDGVMTMAEFFKSGTAHAMGLN